ncbi:MAG: molybdopterin-dependent oxidoreductase [Thermoleophilia bacterium]|nr:molybdopterin-dependent oxidoreductase [Thermoleophilia bacterium]
MFTEFTRREFFKKAGILGTALALSGCGGNRAEERLVPFLKAPEEQVAGVFTNYASLCRQCPAGCGILVKTMGGRAHKIEGNPRHPLNQGKLCARGQAGLQALYNPDRLTGPQARVGGRDSAFGSITWDEAVVRLTGAVKEAQATPGGVGVLAGQLPDHLYRLASLMMLNGQGGDRPSSAMGRPPVVWNLLRACDGGNLLADAMNDLYGQRRLPFFDIGGSDVLLSFAANLFETWLSPVYFGRTYGEMRRGSETSRGYFVHVESRLSTTGVNADEWYAAPPGREAEVALVLGKVILTEQLASPDRPRAVDAYFADVDPRRLAGDLGLSFESLVSLARTIGGAEAALAIPGGGLGGSTNARAAVRAVMALNLLVGADQGGLRVSTGVPDPVLGPTERVSSFEEVQSLVEAMRGGEVQVLLVLDGDPLHDLPAALGFEAAAAKVPLIVDFSSFPTDTGEVLADLRLPSPTYLETWGYQVPQPGTSLATLGAQQPVVRQLHDTRSPVDLLLAVAKGLGGAVAAALPWENEVSYLKDSVSVLATRGGASIVSADPEAFHARWQQFGGWWSTIEEPRLGPPSVPARLELGPPPENTGGSASGRYLLRVYPSLLLAEGRHANLPWMQEVADTMTTVMWDSWVEVNPKAAADLGVRTGDIVKVSSNVGSVEAPVYVYPGIGPDMVAMPLGQGHRAYGRYAAERGADPAALLEMAAVAGTGELAWSATQVSLEKTGRSKRLARLERSAAEEIPEGL